MKRNWRLPTALFAILYGLLAVPWVFWPVHDPALGLTFFGLYLLLAAALAADTVETFLALWWPGRPLPRSSAPPARGKVAVLLVACDDVRMKYLEGLLPLAEAGYHVYFLDDSQTPTALPESLKPALRHVRRFTRTGAKAGNINNWLRTYGQAYAYVLLLDSDSLLEPDAADKLVQIAEHPAQADVAILQAKVAPRAGCTTLFARLLGSGARPRMRVLERVHGALGLSLSFGHNQLLRLDAIRPRGGLEEALAAEDTVLSLELVAAGWRIELADVWSRDTEPATVWAYARRTIRWARQTVELFSRPWYRVPLRYKLLLSRHLLSYWLPIIGLTLLYVSLLTGPSSPEAALNFAGHALTFRPGYEFYGMAILPSLCIFLLNRVLCYLLAVREGIAGRRLLLGWLFSDAATIVLLVPLAWAMLASALGFRVRFIPTNSAHALVRDRDTGLLLVRLGLGLLLVCGLLAAAWSHPGALVISFNAVWISSLVLSPVSLLVLTIADRRVLNTGLRRAGR